MAQTIKVSQRSGVQPIHVANDAKFMRGADGFSPTVEVVEAVNGFDITITDADGPETFFLPSGNAITPEQVQQAVKDYLAENPIEPFETDETLTLANGVLSVNTAEAVEQDNTLPVTSAAVYTEVGNIEAILKTI